MSVLRILCPMQGGMNNGMNGGFGGGGFGGRPRPPMEELDMPMGPRRVMPG